MRGRAAARLALGLALAVSWYGVALCQAAPSAPTEYDVKAAYLYNFGRFVEWPDPGTADDFEICIVGPDPFEGALDSTLEGARIGEKAVVARRLATLEEAAGCRILFLGDGPADNVAAAAPALATGHVLTVGESPRFLQDGGMIQFVNDGNRIRFDINLQAAQTAGLTLSSDLLRVARTVQGER